jgi:nucleoside-diphosphate-sugar epimerase
MESSIVALHLVTGGSGFVGSNIARMLRERREEVRILDIWRDNGQLRDVEFIQGSINDRDAVAKAMRGIDFVHHNVALVPLAKAGKLFWTVNVDGTRNALRAAKEARVKLFCHMSSSAIFGAPNKMPITHDTPRQPVEIYGQAKLAAEELVLQAGREGMRVSSIRPRTIVGAGRLGIFDILFDWIKDGANIYVIGSGDNLFQFVHIEDLCEVSIQSALQEKPGLYNVGTDRFGTLREDLSALIGYAGTTSKIKSLPIWLAIGGLTVLDKLKLSPLGPWHYLTYHKPFYFDIKPTMDALGWRPKYGNVEMLIGAYDWFLSARRQQETASVKSFHKKPIKQRILRLLKALS